MTIGELKELGVIQRRLQVTRVHLEELVDEHKELDKILQLFIYKMIDENR